MPALCKSTRKFLSGEFANGPDWNGRLFRAACDMVGNHISIETATPMLLAGARPWDAGEQEKAERTIGSAYSEPRQPSRPQTLRNDAGEAERQNTVTLVPE